MSLGLILLKAIKISPWPEIVFSSCNEKFQNFNFCQRKWKNCEFRFFSGFWAKNFWVRLSSLHSTCPEIFFAGCIFFGTSSCSRVIGKSTEQKILILREWFSLRIILRQKKINGNTQHIQCTNGKALPGSAPYKNRGNHRKSYMVIYENIKIIESTIEVYGNMQVIKRRSHVMVACKS